MAYKRNAAVCAPADLGLVYVDEDPRVSERATSTITGYGAFFGPAYGLLVNQFDCSVRAGLQSIC